MLVNVTAAPAESSTFCQSSPHCVCRFITSAPATPEHLIPTLCVRSTVKGALVPAAVCLLNIIRVMMYYSVFS